MLWLRVGAAAHHLLILLQEFLGFDLMFRHGRRIGHPLCDTWRQLRRLTRALACQLVRLLPLLDGPSPAKIIDQIHTGSQLPQFYLDLRFACREEGILRGDDIHIAVHTVAIAHHRQLDGALRRNSCVMLLHEFLR